MLFCHTSALSQPTAIMPTAWCPLCPHEFQNNVLQLAIHLKTTHRMHNSAILLARIIVYTPSGKEEAFQVLKDVREFELSLDQKNQELIKSIQNRDINIEELSNQFSKNCKERIILETDSEKYRDSKNKISCLEAQVKERDENIGELKVQLSKKCNEKTALEDDLLKYRVHYEEEVKNLEKREKELGDQLSSKINDQLILNENFNKYKSFNNEIISERDKKISKLTAKEKKMHIDIGELKAELSEATKEQTSLQKNFKKYKKDSDEKISEKNQKITELNLKIKELYKDVELLKETQRKYRVASDEVISEKDMTVTDLKNEVENLGKDVEESKALLTNVSKEKKLLQENFENFKECSSITIKEKDHEIANLGNKVKNLSKEVEALNVRFFHLYQDFSRQKDLSNKMITEKDSEIANLNSKARSLDREEEKLKGQICTKCKENDCLQQELKNCKQLSDEIIEKNKSKNENTLAEMELKLKRHREIFCMLKNSITGVANMYDDTNDKLLEAIKITSQSRKIAENNLIRGFQELEKEVARLYPEENIFIPKLSVRKDIFKQETVDTQNLVEDADTQFNNGGDALKSCNKELDMPGERIGKERRSLNLKRKHAE